MEYYYNTQAPKKATNLSINSDLLNQARSLNINLSATLEQSLNTLLAKQKAQQWKQRNRFAIQAHNEALDEHGCFSDSFRTFAKNDTV